MATGTGLPLPQRRPVLAEPGPIVRADTGTAQAWQQLADIAGRASDLVTDLALRDRKEAEREAVFQASRQGEQAVTRTPDGKLTVRLMDRSDEAAIAHDRAARASYFAQFEMEQVRAAQDLQLKHSTNVEGWDAAWGGHADGVYGEIDPRLIPQAKILLDRIGMQSRNEILSQRIQLDRTNAAATIKTRLSSQEDDFLSLAQLGALQTPEAAGAFERFRGYLEEGVASGLWPQAVADASLDRLAGRGKVWMVLGQIGRTWEADGAEAALASAEAVIGDPGLNFGIEDREAFRRYARATIGDLEQGRARAGSQEAARLSELRTRQAASLSVRVERGEVSRMELLDAYGRGELTPQDWASLTNRVETSTRKAREDAARFDRVERAGQPAPPVVDRIVMAESGGRADARNPRSSATGAGQFLDATWLEMVRKHAPEVTRVSSLSGRPVLTNEDGTFSTEETITVEMDGRFMNIPTIWDGKRVPEEEAIEQARRSGQDFPTFDTLEAAETAARERTATLGEAGIRDLTDAEVLALRSDPELSRRMVAAYAEDNARYLSGQGLPTDDGALYLAHHFGPAGAAQILEAAPDMPVSGVVGPAVMEANPHLRGMTAGDLRTWAGTRVGAPVPFLDPRNEQDRRDVSDHYAALSPHWNGLDPEQRAAVQVDYVRRHGIVPVPLASELRTTIRRGRPEARVRAAQTMLAIDRTAEEAAWASGGFDEQDLAHARMVELWLSAGQDHVTALAMADEAVRQATKPVREARAEEYRDTHKKADAADLATRIAEAGIGALPGSLVPGPLGAMDWVFGMNRPLPAPAAMLDEFQRAAEEFHAVTGDIDVARDMAWRRVRTRWAETTIGGRRFMHLAPEAVYANQHGTDWIREQLFDDLRQAGGLWNSGQPIEERMTLEWDRQSSETNPAYVVLRRDENGLIAPVAGDDGRPMLWRPHWPTSPAARRRQEAIDQEIGEMRQERARSAVSPPSQDQPEGPALASRSAIPPAAERGRADGPLHRLIGGIGSGAPIEVGPVNWDTILPDLQAVAKAAKGDAERIGRWLVDSGIVGGTDSDAAIRVGGPDWEAAAPELVKLLRLGKRDAGRVADWLTEQFAPEATR